ncbi:MAG TPA: HD domain-containing protein [Planctomycetota bacterium]|nr:HD domain-containing protein [Planctomycetota bacterium]HPY74097.1 HD domain-containing protein [Planctomycetota bacterium]HQA99643.1 HD domain-containing protein [Planctomycetota bacterium]
MEQVLSFFKNIGKLKTIHRKGWFLRNVFNPESVAEHSFRVAIMAWYFAKKENLNMEQCLQLGLFHDIAESIIGDITPHDGILEQDKLQQETSVFKKFAQEIQQEQLFLLWKELCEEKTPESILVKEVDKIEMLLQALEYQEIYQKKIDLKEFWSSTKTNWQFSHIQEFYNLIKKKYNILVKTMEAWLQEYWKISPKNLSYYEKALTISKNQRYAGVGDKFIYFAVFSILSHKFSEQSEDWSMQKTHFFVENVHLWKCAINIQLDSWIQTSKSIYELTVKDWGNVMEALFYAILEDLGFDTALSTVSHILQIDSFTGQEDLQKRNERSKKEFKEWQALKQTKQNLPNMQLNCNLESSNKSANQTVNKSANQTVTKSVDQTASADQTATKSANQTVNKSANQTTTKSANQTVTKNANLTATKNANLTATKSTNQIATKSTNQTATKSANQIATKSANLTATKSTEDLKNEIIVSVASLQKEIVKKQKEIAKSKILNTLHNTFQSQKLPIPKYKNCTAKYQWGNKHYKISYGANKYELAYAILAHITSLS